MSLKRNVVANYASQLYATMIGIVLIPLFLTYMGPEAYGLVGFFAMLQAWFNVLDLGLTPTLARESARFFGGALAPIDYRRLYRALSTIFLSVAAIGGGLLFALAPVVSDKWLQVRELPVGQVVSAVQIMALSVAMRWMGGLYRGVITGAERLVWLGGFNALIATLRFAAVFLSMSIWGYTPAVFFWHQLVVAALELLFLYLKSQGLLPVRSAGAEPIGWSFRQIRPLLRFSLTIALTSSIWILVTQTDKLILSGLVPLSEYGYFTLAVLAAGGITILTGPISTALLPRLAHLHAQGNHAEIVRLYHKSAQLVSVITGSLAVTLVVCAEPLLFAWTGNRELTQAAAPILQLYAIGNGLLALGAFPYYLQYALGDLRLHLIGNVVMVCVLVPAIGLAATRAGGIGAGWVWVVLNALYLFGWVGYVHAKLVPGLHSGWIVDNVFLIILPTALVGWLVGLTTFNAQTRTLAFAQTLLVGLASLATATLASPACRSAAIRLVKSGWQRAPG
ncbi:MAG: oligosaccharide flippase family protein [Gemmatimonadales bacterium]|nr:oligosaccharide flippase family protein [Gemmatimonadales bacterium]MDZ4390389.1 oligosaccharide flippase family protein [Gemmatimonadales bacterium]